MSGTFMRSRATLVASAGFFLLLLLGAGAFLVIRSGNGDTPTATPTPGRSAAPRAHDASCPTSSDIAMVMLPPVGVSWESLPNGFQLPRSRMHGPCNVTATTASGYARTPTGALLASAHLLVRSGTPTPIAIAEDTITTQFIAGPDRDRTLSVMRAPHDGAITPHELGRITAFKIISYDPDTAVVSLAVTNDILQGQYVTLSLVVRWVDGDWRMVAPAGGDWSAVARFTPILDGYVAWGP